MMSEANPYGEKVAHIPLYDPTGPEDTGLQLFIKGAPRPLFDRPPGVERNIHERVAEAYDIASGYISSC